MYFAVGYFCIWRITNLLRNVMYGNQRRDGTACHTQLDVAYMQEQPTLTNNHETVFHTILKPGFYPNAIACVACVAFGWKSG